MSEDGSMRGVFVDTLFAEARRDPSVLLVTGDLGFGVLDRYAAELPGSYVNAGVAEQNMTLVAAGSALAGRVAFTYSIANFPTMRCLEMLRNTVAYHQAPVVVVAVGGGFSYGNLGMSHHAVEDLAVMRAITGMTVVAPSDLDEARDATRALVAQRKPAYLRIDKTWAEPTPGAAPLELGRARVLREGDELTVFTCGGVAGEVLTACDALAAKGRHLRVVSMHTVKPLDHEAVRRAARETGGVVSVEEHVAIGGLGAAIAESLADAQCWPTIFRRIALPPDEWAPVGGQGHLRRWAGIDANSLQRELESLLR